MKIRLTSLAIALGCVGALAALALSSQRTLEDGLPKPVVCADQIEANAQARNRVQEHGGATIMVLGTGSMAPWIPAAPKGQDPWATLVAYAVTRAGATFDDVAAGDPCLYMENGRLVLHSAARKNGDTWVMSGLNNRKSDVWMTRETFFGIVAVVYLWPLEGSQ